MLQLSVVAPARPSALDRHGAVPRPRVLAAMVLGEMRDGKWCWGAERNHLGKSNNRNLGWPTDA